MRRRTYGAEAKKSIDGKYQTAVVYGGYIYRSTDYGSSWTQVGPTANWNSVAMSSTGQYQTAVVYGGYIYRSTDYGSSWTQVCSNAYWNSVDVTKYVAP